MEDIPSEQTTLLEHEHKILTQISPYFHIEETKYGGNGCFSYDKIPAGKTILISKSPVGFTISKDFKKEICQYCFHYDNGNNLKFKVGLPKFNQFLYFCSEACIESFHKLDPNKLLTESLLTLENNYNQGLKKPEINYNGSDLDNEAMIKFIDNKWKEVEVWDKSIRNMKPTKWFKFIPRINESEYMEIKYILSILYQMYCKDLHKDQFKQYYDDHDNKTDTDNKLFLNDLTIPQYYNAEIQLFEFLQSHEILKVLKFPELLESYINIYKFIRLTSPPQFQSFIDPLTIRLIIGRNVTNAFGIWSNLENGENKEFFGFGVYPSGSFFNHSCSPNIRKIRKGNELHFVTKCEISPNDELCIDYGNYLNENVTIRKKELSEWFFDCGCKRCSLESV